MLCRSLSEQSHTLQDRLRETGDMCQQLLRRLEQQEGPALPGGSTEVGGATGGVDPQSPLSSGFIKVSVM